MSETIYQEAIVIKAHNDSITSASFLPTSANSSKFYLATGSLDNTVNIFEYYLSDTNNEKLLQKEITVNKVSSITENSSIVHISTPLSNKNILNNTFAYTCLDGKISYLNNFNQFLNSNFEHIPDSNIFRFDAGPMKSFSMAISQENNILAFGGSFGQVNIYNINNFNNTDNNTNISSLPALEGEFIMDMSFSPARKNLLAVCTSLGHLVLFDIENSKILSKIRVTEVPLRCISFSSDGNLIYVGANDFLLYILEIGNKNELHNPISLPSHNNWVTDIDVNNLNSNQFASTSLDKTVKIWDLSTMKTTFSFNLKTEGTCLSFCPNHNLLVSGSSDGTLTFFEGI